MQFCRKFTHCYFSAKWKQEAQLSPRDRAMRHVLNVAQMFIELHLVSPALHEWFSRSAKVTENGTNK